LATIALGLVDPFRLIELDLGSNFLTDEMIPPILNLIEKSHNLFIVELCGNKFSSTGIEHIVEIIASHKSIAYVRLSSVLLDLEELRTAAFIDLSLPRVYTMGIERVVQSVFEACMEVDSLKSNFFGVAKKGTKKSIESHFMTIRELIANDYRLVGRDFYRSIPPTLIQLVIERIAHRLGKYAVPDPGLALDLHGQRAVDGIMLTSELSVIQERLYLSFLDEADMMLACRVIRKWNTVVTDIDLHGMPLVRGLPEPLMDMLIETPSIRTINLNGCGIKNPKFFNLVCELLQKDFPVLREISLKGNPATKGRIKEFNDIVDDPRRQSRPHISVDQVFHI
jgi:hypothetical protein